MDNTIDNTIINNTMNEKINDQMKKVYKLLTILYVLNIGDYFTTVLALNNGGIESNIIVKYFIDNGNFHWFKFIGISLLTLYLIWRSKTNAESQIRIVKLLKWANVAYGLIVIINITTYSICSL